MKYRQPMPSGVCLRITLPDNSYGYGRLLEDPHVAFFDHRTTVPDDSCDVISWLQPLFIVAVHRATLARWHVIKVCDYGGEMNDKLVFFWQDIANYKDCQIRKFGSRAIQATPEECLGLERDAVWDEDVEERLLDATLRRRNNSEEVLKVRLSDCSKIDFDHQMRRFVLNVNSTATPLYGHLVSWGYGGGGQTWLQVLQERIGNELGSEAISTLEYNNTSDGFTIRSLQRAILFRIQLWIRAWERNPSELYAFIGSLPDGVVIPAQTNDTR